MKTSDKLKILESLYGGPVKAAHECGVTYATWWNWSQGRNMSGASERVIDLLLDRNNAEQHKGEHDAVNDPGVRRDTHAICSE